MIVLFKGFFIYGDVLFSVMEKQFLQIRKICKLLNKMT